MAQPATISPVYDTEADRIKEQLLLANTLRKQGMSNDIGQGYQGGKVFIVGNPWGKIASAIGGEFIGNRAREDQGAMEQRQQQERDAFLAAMPSATETQHYDPVANPGTGPLVEGMEVPRDARALAQATQAWEARAPRGMEGVQQFALQQALTAPQRQAEQEFRAKEAANLAAERQAAELQRQRERLEEQARRERERAQDRADNIRLAASLRPASGEAGPKMQLVDTVDKDGNPVKVAVDMRNLKPGEEFGKPKKPPTAAENKQAVIDSAPGKIESIMKEAEKNEKSFGIVPAAASMLPNIIGSRVVSKHLTEDQRVAREKVMAQAAETIHALYGAALSRNEAGRADAWAVNPTDDYDTVMSKLRMAKEYATSRAGNKPAPKPGAAPGGRRVYNPVTEEFE